MCVVGVAKRAVTRAASNDCDCFLIFINDRITHLSEATPSGQGAAASTFDRIAKCGSFGSQRLALGIAKIAKLQFGETLKYPNATVCGSLRRSMLVRWMLNQPDA